jgi:general secretion pathway protein A
MYNEYFGFREKPFNVTPDPRYFYTNPIYQEAYASLLYGIRERKGFIVLTGEVGTGKTTLLRRLMNNPEENVRLVFFYNTTLTFEELVRFACEELGLPVKGSGRLEKIQALNEFLVGQSKKGGTVVLLVDEAQNLTDDVLENLRLLSNLETATEKLLQIVLVGQSELDVKLSQPQLRQIKQRVALQCRLDRLKDREVGPFINYRLRVAGYEREELFTADAIKEVASRSRGIPRLINIICDNALLIAYATSVKKISADIIREVANDLRLNAEGRVADGDPSTAKTVTRVGKNEKETRANIRVEEVASRHPRKLKPVLVGSLAVSILVLLIGGIVFYQPDLDAWLSDVVFGRFKWAKIQSGILPEPSGDSRVVSQGGKSPGTETALASARQTDAAPTPNTAGNAPERLERVSSPSLDQPSAGSTKASAVQNEQSVVIPRGSTISRIATEVYGTDKILLAMDLLKEFNPRIEDMNWVLAGQKLSVPPLTRETLLRRQPDDTYHLILDSFFNAQEAEKLGKTVRLKGYEVAITPRKVSNNLVLHRVEIPGLKNLETANHAWEVAAANRWIAVSSESPPRQVP